MGHSDRHELGGAFAVPHDQLRQRGAETGQDGLEGDVVGRVGRCDGGSACGAVGQKRHRVVGRSVAVDGDAVEGAGDGVLEEGGERGGGDGRVGAENAQKRGHARVDHACAFGHAC